MGLETGGSEASCDLLPVANGDSCIIQGNDSRVERKRWIGGISEVKSMGLGNWIYSRKFIS